MLPLLLVLVLCSTATPLTTVSHYVNPFIGSGGSGFGAGGHNPGAQVPFGILRLGPDTVTDFKNHTIILPFNHYGGYSYLDNTVVAFSHTHLVGAGVGDLGNFGLMPFHTTDPDLSRLINQHGAPLLHDNERALPGMYSVKLPGLAQVELVASGTHSGSHLYTFVNPSVPSNLPSNVPSNVPSNTPTAATHTCGVLLDVCHTAMGNGHKVCKDATVNVTTPLSSTGDNQYIELTASLKMAGALSKRSPNHGISMYFVARINRTNMAMSIWQNNALVPAATSGTSDTGSLGVLLHDDCSTPLSLQPLRINVGLSFISLNHAQQNMMLHQTHAQALQATTQVWESLLSNIQVVVEEEEKNTTTTSTTTTSTTTPTTTTPTTKNPTQPTNDDLLVKFYTSIYHSYLAPSTYDEHNGDYMSFGGGGDNSSSPSTVRTLGDVPSDHRTHAYSKSGVGGVAK